MSSDGGQNLGKQGRVLIFSAPSGSGKSTIVGHLLQQGFDLHFSISATSRAPRGEEQHGREYYFFSEEEFRQRIRQGEFLEYEEVYPGKFYGTLRAPIEALLHAGHHVVFDVDVVGGCHIKDIFGERALSVFICPPSIEELARRLHARATDSSAAIAQRIAKAEEEMSYADRFDLVIVNDNLDDACRAAVAAVRNFLGA